MAGNNLTVEQYEILDVILIEINEGNIEEAFTLEDATGIEAGDTQAYQDALDTAIIDDFVVKNGDLYSFNSLDYNFRYLGQKKALCNDIMIKDIPMEDCNYLQFITDHGTADLVTFSNDVELISCLLEATANSQTEYDEIVKVLDRTNKILDGLKTKATNQ